MAAEERGAWDWVAIRERWENTDESDAATAAFWGMKSGTSIRRVRMRESWERNPRVVEAGMRAAAALMCAQEEARTHPAHTPHTPETPVFAGVPTIGVCAEGGDLERAAEEIPHRTEPARLTRTQPLQVRLPMPEAVRVEAEPWQDSGGLRKPDDLVRARETQNTRQMQMAQRMEDLATEIQLLCTVLVTSDTESVDGQMAIADATMKLRALNPEKDSLEKLLAVSTKMLESSTKLKRAALGMEVPGAKVAGYPADSNPGVGATGGPIDLSTYTDEEIRTLREINERRMRANPQLMGPPR